MQTFWNKAAALSAEKYPVGRIVAFFPVRIAEVREMGLEFGGVAFRHVDAREDTAVVGTVIAVVKQADVPVRPDRVQKVEQGTRPFRELKSEQALIADAC